MCNKNRFGKVLQEQFFLGVVCILLASCQANIVQTPFYETQVSQDEIVTATIAPSNQMPSEDVLIDESSSLILTATRKDNSLNFFLVNPSLKVIIQLETSLIPRTWSPNGDKLLLSSNEHEVIIASRLGSDPQIINKLQHSYQSWWLNNSNLLVAEFQDNKWSTLYQLDISTGEKYTIRSPDLSIPSFIQAVSTSGNFWIELHDDLKLYLADINGDVIKFAHDLDIRVDDREAAVSPVIAILPNNNIAVFGCDPALENQDDACHLFILEVDDGVITSKISAMNFGKTIVNVDSLRASPNGKYLAFTDSANNDFVIVGMEDPSIIRISWPQTTSVPLYIWSPNSSQLATTYIDNEGSTISILDIKSGEYLKVMSEPLTSYLLLDWKFY